jgi:hypothetical protein
MKFGNFNFLEPPGPLQACNGTALPFTFLKTASRIVKIGNYMLKRPKHSKIEIVAPKGGGGAAYPFVFNNTLFFIIHCLFHSL